MRRVRLREEPRSRARFGHEHLTAFTHRTNMAIAIPVVIRLKINGYVIFLEKLLMPMCTYYYNIPTTV